ncbi:rod shape-determining protein MreC [Patescibacteria group bacterium]|nr:rod shape-determining protein MreC [Patescibacteria group bacterium]
MKKFLPIFFVILLFYVLSFLLHGENLFFLVFRPTQRYLYDHQQSSVDEKKICEDLKTENLKLKFLRSENEILREHLDFLTSSQDKFILANVLGRQQESELNWIIINQGRKKGLTPGLAVVDQKGSLIGTIIEVKDYVSYVRPLINLHSLVAADVISFNSQKEKSRITSGIIQGEYNLILKMKNVPLSKEVKIGDSVITSGLEKKIRRGLLIGEILEIKKTPNDIFQELIIDPLGDQNPRIVSVLLLAD